MRKATYVIAAATLLLASGFNMKAWTNQLVDNYYTDATFTTACGYQDTNCTVVTGWLSDGCRTNWRYHEVYSCETSDRTSAACQELQNGQWVTISCPDDTLTAQESGRA